MAPMQWPGTAAVLDKAVLDEAVLDTAEMTRAGGAMELPCRDDPELFFAESPDDVEFAKSLCMGCAARLACLAGAIERREPWGVWGGEVFQRGEVVPYKRPRGRPRKTTVAA
jgi:WhiB family transcriptional regulator, redox-sensing transcriptional regulator